MGLPINLKHMIKKQDIPKEFNNKNLENEIAKVVADNTQENQDKFTSLLAKSHLYTLVGEGKDEDDNKNILLLQTINENKETFLPVFTNEEEMKYAREKCDFDCVLISFDEIANLILDQGSDFRGFIINADSDNIIIEQKLVEYIVEKNAPKDGNVDIQAGQTVEVRDFDVQEFPKDMIDALTNHFVNQKNISSAYIRLLNHNGEQSYLLVTEFEGQKTEVFKKISEVARPHLDGFFLDQLEYNTNFGREATKDIKPFYRRKVFGIF